MARSFSRRLRQARQSKGLSASKLDAAAGLTRCHTWQIESGRKLRIELDTAVKLAAALDVSLDWLVWGRGTGPVAA